MFDPTLKGIHYYSQINTKPYATATRTKRFMSCLYMRSLIFIPNKKPITSPCMEWSSHLIFIHIQAIYCTSRPNHTVISEFIFWFLFHYVCSRPLALFVMFHIGAYNISSHCFPWPLLDPYRGITRPMLDLWHSFLSFWHQWQPCSTTYFFVYIHKKLCFW